MLATQGGEGTHVGTGLARRGWRDGAGEMSKYVRIGEPVLSLRACGFTNMEREETRTYSGTELELEL